ncbi:hypothetical protein HF086_010128 [Spodoptera exigua]|uniref:Uncharacterized protein n=1 Tax=Spodoptera exigua TaxID=7107 RepID=A0A922MZF8_SPOEX|nr:hypothetical protein HF086_010128 [Spodoptera exigua]
MAAAIKRNSLREFFLNCTKQRSSSQDYNDDIRQEQMLEMQILSSQTEQRRLTPPESSRSGSEEALPLRDTTHKQRVSNFSFRPS